MQDIFVKKADGEIEPLDYNKIKYALRRSGANSALIDEIFDEIQPKLKNGISTKKIYRMAFSQLRELRPGAAARFGLKSSLMKMGPDGYPFETFMGALLKGRGYETKLRQIIYGKCVSHEIDVLATRPKKEGHRKTKSIIECKFHNAPHIKCHIQSALYSWARFLDIQKANPSIDSVWLATNTKFSWDVVKYADCIGLKLVGWSFPKHESLQVRIEENKLYPITILPKLDRRTFRILHDARIILLKELINEPVEDLKQLGLKEKQILKMKEHADIIMSRKK